ncbi:MAG: PAS domain-containing methyl-accepting chemotaxis protein [Thiotrichales bacterium]|nr:PAS domain-containing methyl-accepting chemotaxis protein [Thiotrichales bacterium]
MFCQNYKTELKTLKSQLNEKNSILNALERVTAVIEFDLGGTILWANDNFLKTMGYSLDEISGQHHRIFLDAEQANSTEYATFWQSLSAGEVLNGRYQRVDKSGNVVWLEASYNPVLDSVGKPYKVIKFATDITEQVIRDQDASAQLKAINKVMGVIEFSPDGTILTANPNFLKIMGYSLAEIKGQHHKMFALPEATNTPAYQAFWKGLASGESFAGTYHRIGKGGKEIWLEASYNPIFDLKGRVVKVIKYATDISANPNSILLNEVVEAASNAISSMASGDLTGQMVCLVKDDDKGMYDEDIRILTKSVVNMGEKLKEVISKVVGMTDNTKQSASDIHQRANSLNERLKLQKNELQRTTTTMSEMNTAIQETSNHVQQASQVANQVETKANKGVEVMQQTIDAMNKIQESSERISDIVALIDGIAFQTNLLALNAAVEAARAGEQGRGFAVVAGEVRSLAQKSADAAKDIKQLIDETVTRVNQGSTMASESGEVLESIHLSIGEITQMIAQVADDSKYQAQGIQDVNSGVGAMEKVTTENAHLVSETLSSVDKLDQQANELSSDMQYFKL